MFPIFIPSKGRWSQTNGTVVQLLSQSVPFVLVVEPHEAHLYKLTIRNALYNLGERNLSHQETCDDATAAIGSRDEEENRGSGGGGPAKKNHHFVFCCGSDTKSCSSHDATSSPSSSCLNGVVVEVLPLSNQGISYTRNYILHSLAPSKGWFWMMDDDIRCFQRASGGKNIRIAPRELLLEVGKRMLCHPNTSLFSLEYEFYAYSADDQKVAVNSYNNIAVLLNKEVIPGSLRYRFRIREDYDFTLQLIKAGKSTIRFRNLSFRVPRMAAAAGGMTQYYTTQGSDIRDQNALFVQEWPSVSRETVKGEAKAGQRYDMFVAWPLLNPSRCANPAALLASKEPLPAPRGGCTARRKRIRPQLPSEEECSENSDGKATEVRRGAKEKVSKPAGWLGWEMEEWRNVDEPLAARAGLQASRSVSVGDHIAFVPQSCKLLPSIMTGIVICRRPGGPVTVVPDRQFRDVPIQNVEWSFNIPVDIASCSDLLDKVLQAEA